MHNPPTTESKSKPATRQAGALFGGGAMPFFQPKLTVNQPGDAYEQEADHIADKVMRMREGDAPVVQRMFAPAIQRACAHCEEKRREEEGVQRKETGGSDAGGQSAPSIVSDVLSSGGGHTMDANTQDFMSSRMGADFSNVRIHTDGMAAESASAIQARAYTSGNNIVFGQGEYQPGTEEGKRLLAHELVHTIQQGNNNVKRTVAINPMGTYTPASASTSIMRLHPIGAAIPLNVETGRALVQEFNQRLANVATRVIPFSNQSTAIASTSSGGPSVQAFPKSTSNSVIQRAGGQNSSTGSFEAGIVGSIQVCIDFCTGEMRVVGWIWGGAGYDSSWGWYGAYAFFEQEFWRGNLGLGHLDCGTCDPSCNAHSGHGDSEFGGGIGGFPIVIRPGESARLRKAGLEVGFLLTPRTRCDANLEVIALVDLLQYAGPAGQAVSRFAAAANEIAQRFGAHVECQLGIDGSGIIHLCKSTSGRITSDSAEVCIGAFVACGFGLSHDKNALPRG